MNKLNLLDEIWKDKNFILPNKNLIKKPSNWNSYVGVKEVDLTCLFFDQHYLILNDERFDTTSLSKSKYHYILKGQTHNLYILRVDFDNFRYKF